jgi:hypothetical protein
VLAGDLFVVVIRDRAALVDATEAVHRARIEEQGGNELCLARTGMADDGHVPDAGGIIDLHRRVPSA